MALRASAAICIYEGFISMNSVQFSGGLFWPGKNRLHRQDVPKAPVKACALSEDREADAYATSAGTPEASAAQVPRSFAVPSASFRYGSGVKMERDFIRMLRQSKNPQEKADLTELLGRSHSINALPHILQLLGDDEDVHVRTVAAKAISNIGSGTNPNSFTATELTGTLLEAYQHRKTQMASRLAQPLIQISYADKLKEKEIRQALMEELKTLAYGISQLNVQQGRAALHGEYRKTMLMNQLNDAQVQEMIQATEQAQQEFYKELEKKYQKPVDEILNEVSDEEMKEMRKKVSVQTPQGETVNLLEALTQIAFLQEQQEQFSSELLLGLMDALSIHKDRESSGDLKMALTSNHAEVKAKALKLLSKRNGLSYNSDVYPNLHAQDPLVRSAALKALLNSQELPAKQKTMELLKPKAFLELAGGVGRKGLESYAKFLNSIAKNGDEYIEALASRATHSNYDLETRQIALLALGLIAQEPAVHPVSNDTLMKARAIIRAMAVSPVVRDLQDGEALRLTATKLWVQQKDPAAIANAILLANHKSQKPEGPDQAQLLSAVYAALLDSHQKTKAERLTETEHQLLDVLRSGPNKCLDAHTEKNLRQALGTDRIYKILNPASLDEFLAESALILPDQKLLAILRNPQMLQQLRPHLHALAETEKSNYSQMLALRITGLLQDEGSVNYLKQRVADPLKGKIDWKADTSYQGNPAIVAGNVRMNALQALGDIGDYRALPTMIRAMGDANLRLYVPESMAKVAPDANKRGNEATLKKARAQLVKLMESPDVSRQMRAVRIKAADALFKFNGGPEEIKAFATRTTNPNFKRHVLSTLITNDHGLEPEHPDFELVKAMLNPGLGIERLHQQGITGKGIDMAIVDGGYVDQNNREGFQNRVKLPAVADDPGHPHPTMVMSTAAANGKLKGVAPDARVFSDKWPDFKASDTMEVYKKIIEGKLRGENNVRIINNSWGFSNQNAILHKDIRKILQDYKNVVDLAEKAGIQIVFAAGNEGEQVGFPGLGTLSVFGLDVDKLTAEERKLASYILDKVILAGAVNTQGSENREEHRMSEFSSRGDNLNGRLNPTVIAPGSDMMVYGWDRHQGNPKTLVNGTSFASPYVSGLLALMLQKNPNLTPAQMRDVLKKTAVRLPDVPVTEQGYGEVSPEAAVKMAGELARAGLKRKKQPPAQSGDGGNPPNGDAIPANPTPVDKQAGIQNANHLALNDWQSFRIGSDDESVWGPQTSHFEKAAWLESSKTLDSLNDLSRTTAGKTSNFFGERLSQTGKKNFLQGAPTVIKLPNRPLLSKHTPSTPSRNDFRRSPSALPRMNPPKAPAMVTIR